MISMINVFEEDDEIDNFDKEQFFEDRTNYHISLVNKYLDKILELHDSRIDTTTLEKEQEIHDQSKFEEPEYTPYIELTWNYHLKDLGKKIKSSEEELKQIQQATFYHVKNNKHHPESWDEKSTIESINNKDRDKPPEQMVDATKMPLENIACMVADWCAMSEEKGTDPYEWCKNNINKRWKFKDKQIEFIYNLLDKIWKR